jgi:Dyp-type peroxidase family
MRIMDLSGQLDLAGLTAEHKALLDDLQPNIVKAHTRDHCYLFPLRFTDAAKARTLLHELANKMKTASEHFAEIAAHKAKPPVKSTVPYIGVHLSAKGYAALGAASKMPGEPAFAAGMKASGASLNDPQPNAWDLAYQGDVHALVIVAGSADTASIRATDAAANQIFAKLGAGVVLTGLPDIGQGMASLKAPGEGIEHFGYVDGRSQPLFTKQDIKSEKTKNAKINGLPSNKGAWDPKFPLSQVLVKDPGVASPSAHGSYFVFRKLEQDVHGFKAAEEKLGEAFGLTGAAAERMGAAIVGRFEDGTPYTLQDSDGLNEPVPNDFDYSGDAAGLKCPFSAHIRKTNPRLSAPGVLDRRVIMARRGVTYGRRDQHPNDPALKIKDMPTGAVGLLFMAYQADISNQFEVTQRHWANDPSFPPNTAGVTTPGVDPVIGQGGSRMFTQRATWNDPASVTKSLEFKNFVHLRGGEYFFAPSISTLKTI